MCTITQHYNHCWTMNLESGESIGVSERFDRSDAVSIDSQELSSQRSISLQPEQLPKGYSPRPVDVCCGRGKKNWRHQGNSSFRKLIHSNVAAYMDASSKHEKTRLVKSIVEMVRSNGGRFLKQSNDGYWYDIGDSQAREKVGHSLRDQVTALSKQKKEASGLATPKPKRPSVSSSYTPLPHHQLSSAHASPYLRPLHQGSNSAVASVAGAASSSAVAGAIEDQSPLNEVGELPSDLAGILSQIHFPSIQSPTPNRLESSSSSFAPSSYSSMHASGQNLRMDPSSNNQEDRHQQHHRSFNSSIASGLVNFFEPLDEAMEPTPLMAEQQQQQQQQLLQQQQLQQQQQLTFAHHAGGPVIATNTAPRWTPQNPQQQQQHHQSGGSMNAAPGEYHHQQRHYRGGRF